MTVTAERTLRAPIAFVLACLAFVLAITMAPGRALAHEAIPGTTGVGTAGNPVMVDTWGELKGALELEENLYIQVTAKLEKLKDADNMLGEGSSGDCMTIPEGYAKDLDVESQIIYESNPTQGNFANFIFISDGSTLILHGANTNAAIDVGSGFRPCTAICNRGELYVYGNVSIKADRLQKDGLRCARGIVCAGDSKLVISGTMENDSSGKPFKTSCEIRGSAEKDLSKGIGGGVYVKSASSVDIFGGELSSRNDGSGVLAHNGLVIDTSCMSKVRVHGGVVQGLSFVGDTATSYLAKDIVGWATNINQHMWDNYYSVKAEHDDFMLSAESGGELCRQWVHYLEAQVKPLNSYEAWSEFTHLQSFTAGDGVTYNLAFSEGKAVGAAAVAYETRDSSVVMTSKPVYPVLCRDSDAADDLGVCKALPTLQINNGTFNPMDGAWGGATITSIELPEDVTYIGQGAFADTYLKEISIPSKVNIIETGAFADSKLEKVYLPVLENGPMLTIGEDAFLGSHLKEISCAHMGEVKIEPHAYGYYWDSDTGEYVMNKPFAVNAIPDYPFWEDAVQKGFIADLRAATVEPIPEQPYLGSKIEPKPVVTVKNDLGTVTLKEGVDYTLTYEKNDAIGEASVSIIAIEPPNYGGTTATFDIIQATITDATIYSIPNQVYTGKAITPKVTAKIGDVELKEGVDYTVEYKDNVKAGKATIILTGKGYYAGTKTVTFLIVEPVPIEWKRLSGDTALDTMAAIVDAGGFSTGGTVVLASLEGYWDALTAAGIAGKVDAPVLMVLQDSVPAQTAAQIKKLKPTKIIVCGGTYWIPDDVVAEAAKVAGLPMSAVTRLAGDNAAITAAKIAEYGKSIGGGWTDIAIVATAGTFQDALAAAPLSYAKALPIFLAQYDFATEKGYITADTIKAMKDAGVKRCVIVGGEYWLPKSVSDDLNAGGILVLGQLAGDTAVETSDAIAQVATSAMGMSADKMGVADVRKHYDALASAAFCGRNGSVLVLTLDEKSSVIDGFVKSHFAKMTNAYIFGGTSSVSEKTEAALKNATK